jgi:hypothetical protein
VGRQPSAKPQVSLRLRGLEGVHQILFPVIREVRVQHNRPPLEGLSNSVRCRASDQGESSGTARLELGSDAFDQLLVDADVGEPAADRRFSRSCVEP